jgi:hypothetical protein
VRRRRGMRSAPLWQAPEWGLLSWRPPASRRLVGLPSRHRGTVRKVAILKTNSCTVCATDRPDLRRTRGLHGVAKPSCGALRGVRALRPPDCGPARLTHVFRQQPLWPSTLSSCARKVGRSCTAADLWSALPSRTLRACQVSSRTLRALSNVRRMFRAPEKMIRTDVLIRPRCKEVS